MYVHQKKTQIRQGTLGIVMSLLAAHIDATRREYLVPIGSYDMYYLNWLVLLHL